MMKMKFEAPVIEIICIANEDMITTSGFGGVELPLGEDIPDAN